MPERDSMYLLCWAPVGVCQQQKQPPEHSSALRHHHKSRATCGHTLNNEAHKLEERRYTKWFDLNWSVQHATWTWNWSACVFMLWCGCGRFMSAYIIVDDIRVCISFVFFDYMRLGLIYRRDRKTHNFSPDSASSQTNLPIRLGCVVVASDDSTISEVVVNTIFRYSVVYI